MTPEEAQELAVRIAGEKLWRVLEIIHRPGYPRDSSLRVKRSFFSPQVQNASVKVEAEIRWVADYDILHMLASTSTTEDGNSLQGIP